MKKHIFATFIFVLLFFPSPAQDELMKMIDDPGQAPGKKLFTTATFKSTRLINGHSVENAAAGVLDVRISHRFGFINQGAYQLFGLDQASMRFGFDYGLSNRLMIGIGRSTYQKQYDGFVKFKLVRQGFRGNGGSPVTVSLLVSMMIETLKWEDPKIKNYSTSHMVYAWQILVARKFSDALSLQLMPSFVHYNIVKQSNYPNDIFALGAGGRIKLSKRISFNAEYYHILPIALVKGEDYRLPGTTNSLAIGFDIETGGHVFQLHFTNSTGMTEKTFITETTGNFFKGEIHFGFNLSRVFTIRSNRRK